MIAIFDGKVLSIKKAFFRNFAVVMRAKFYASSEDGHTKNLNKNMQEKIVIQDEFFTQKTQKLQENVFL